MDASGAGSAAQVTTKKGVIALVRGLSGYESRTVAYLVWLNLVNCSTLSLQGPFFPGQAAQKGMSPSVTGLVFGCFALFNVLACPLFGKITPNLGVKKVMMGGMTTSGVCYILFGFLGQVEDLTTFTVFCFLIRAVEAVGAAAFLTATITSMAILFPKNMGTIMGVIEMAMGFGYSVGPGIGGLLYGLGGYPTPFVALGAFAVVNVSFLSCIMQSVQGCCSPPKSSDIIKVLQHPPTVMVALMTMFASVLWTYLNPIFAVHLQQFDLTPQTVGLFFLFLSGIYAVSCPVVGAFGDRVNRPWRLMSTGLVFSAVGFLLIGPSPFLPFLPKAMWLNLVSLSIIGVSCAVVVVPTYSALIDYITDGGMKYDMGTCSIVGGLWGSMYCLGDTVGPSISGILTEFCGFGMSTTIIAFANLSLFAISVTFFTWWHQWRPSRSHRGNKDGHDESWALLAEK